MRPASQPANDAGVVENTENQQPPLICLLDAAQICPLLSKAGNFVLLSWDAQQIASLLSLSL